MGKKTAYIVLSFLFLLNLGNLAWGQVEHYKKEYDFTRDYFTSNIPHWKKILKPYSGQPQVHYLEIGTSEGRSALWMLENILTHPTASVTCLDIFLDKAKYARFLSNLILSGFLNKATLVKGRSQVTLRTLPNKGQDSHSHVGFFLPDAAKAEAFHKGLSERQVAAVYFKNNLWHFLPNWEHLIGRKTVWPGDFPFSGPVYQGEATYSPDMLPKSSSIIERLIILPISLEMPDEKIQSIAEALQSVASEVL